MSFSLRFLFLTTLMTIFTLSGASADARIRCNSLLQRGPLWSLFQLFVTPPALKNAESVRLILREMAVARGKMIVGKTNGTAIEKYAAQVEKITGYKVVLSDGANSIERTEGFASKTVVISRPSGDATMSLINLGEKEAKAERLSLTASHEGSHAWLDFLDRTGEGTPLSIQFFDFGGNHSGPYAVYMSAQELKTWSQDIVRVVRGKSEAEIQRRFRTEVEIPKSELFQDLDQALEKIELLTKFSDRVYSDLTDVVHFLKEIEPESLDANAILSLLFKESVAVPGTFLLQPKVGIELSKDRTIGMPLNTRKEWEVAVRLKAVADRPREFASVYSELTQIWLEKALALQAYAESVHDGAEWGLQMMKELKPMKRLTREQYTKIRAGFNRFGIEGSKLSKDAGTRAR